MGAFFIGSSELAACAGRMLRGVKTWGYQATEQKVISNAGLVGEVKSISGLNPRSRVTWLRLYPNFNN